MVGPVWTHEVCGLGADGPKVDGVAALLQEKQLVEGLKDLDGRLVDRDHDGAAAGADVADGPHDGRGGLCVQAARGLVHEDHAGVRDELHPDGHAFALLEAQALAP